MGRFMPWIICGAIALWVSYSYVQPGLRGERSLLGSLCLAAGLLAMVGLGLLSQRTKRAWLKSTLYVLPAAGFLAIDHIDDKWHGQFRPHLLGQAALFGLASFVVFFVLQQFFQWGEANKGIPTEDPRPDRPE